MKILNFILVVLLSLGLKLSAQTSDTILPIVPIDTIRANAIAAMLPSAPKGYGENYHDRTTWNALYSSGNYSSLLSAADSYLTQTMPAISDSLYLAYWTDNSSQESKEIIERRQLWLSVLTWAECLRNDGRYVGKIRYVLHELINQKSWNFPGDDYGKQNFLGTQYTIGLASAAYGHNMAQALYLLDDKLNTNMQDSIRNALDARIFNPTLQAISTNNFKQEFPALIKANNYNPVCLAGVTGAALTVILDSVKRGKFAVIAERYSKNGIAGFVDDGYCTEGIGYYTYALGNYVLLTESLLQATTGQVNLFDHPKIEKIANFGIGMEIINNIYPAIGDSDPSARPGRFVMYYVNRVFELGLSRYNSYVYSGTINSKLTDLMNVYPNAASLITPPAGTNTLPIRTYFDITGLLTSRPAAGSFINMGATFQGGHNGESHNHNDVGSYTIIAGNSAIAGDPGTIPYTPAVFSSERYNFKTLGSFGHPVPLINNKTQIAGDSAKAVVLDTSFTANEDKLVMDIKSAYDEPALAKLHRTFVFNRTDTAYVEIRDDFEFNVAKRFETALITRAAWQLAAPDVIELQSGKEKIRVKISAPAGGFTVVSEVISENDGDPYTRLGIRLNDTTLLSGTVRLVYQRPGYEAVHTGVWNNQSVNYVYNFGTNTGTGQLEGAPHIQGTVTTTTKNVTPVGYLPIPPSGSARLTGLTTGNAKWWLKGNAQSPALRFSSSNGGVAGRFSLYDIANSTPITSVSYRITLNDSTTTACNWQFAIGRSAGAVTQINGANTLSGEGVYSSNPAVFAAVRWLMDGGIFTFSFRDMSALPSDTARFRAVTTVPFVKGGTYNMEFYCNNSLFSQTYLRNGATYTVASRTYHIWVNNIQLSYNSSVAFPANQLAANLSMDGIVFQGQTSKTGVSNNNSAEIRIANITINHAAVEEETLALSLLSFNARKSINSIELNWKAGVNDQNGYFEVLRSNGEHNDFKVIGKVNAGAASVGNYYFRDNQPQFGVNYYQLKQADTNGIVSTSPVKAVSTGYDQHELKVYKNQDQQLYASVLTNNPSEENCSIVIVDVNGRKVSEARFSLKESTAVIPLNMALSSPGLYVATYIKSNTVITSTKFLW